MRKFSGLRPPTGCPDLSLTLRYTAMLAGRWAEAASFVTLSVPLPQPKPGVRAATASAKTDPRRVRSNTGAEYTEDRSGSRDLYDGLAGRKTELVRQHPQRRGRPPPFDELPNPLLDRAALRHPGRERERVEERFREPKNFPHWRGGTRAQQSQQRAGEHRAPRDPLRRGAVWRQLTGGGHHQPRHLQRGPVGRDVRREVRQERWQRRHHQRAARLVTQIGEADPLSADARFENATAADGRDEVHLLDDPDPPLSPEGRS